MQRCLSLAKKGLGSVAPNPLVGSVIVASDHIIGEGWHKMYGESHAEVNAVRSISAENQHLLPESTLYVNLEPCSHHGKTPPCVDLILKHKIPRVVICNVDTNPLVGGKGIEKLRQHGVEVITGILKEQGRWLNRRFFTSMEKKRPYIILKWAQSVDGFIAKNDNQQTWITNEISRRIVHKWRSEEAAILVGKNTIEIDNPQLNNRYFDKEKQPIRIGIGGQLKNESSYHFFDHSQPSIYINREKNGGENNLQYWQFKFDYKLITSILEKLNKESIQSVIIEGGATTLQHFIDPNLWDEARILTGNTLLNDGIAAPQFYGKRIKEFLLHQDLISYYKNN